MAGDQLVGSIPESWKETTLGEACKRGGGDIQTGPFGSQLHASDYVPNGIPSIMPQNIGNNRFNEDGIARITEADAKRLSRYLVRKGDIVYSRRGDVKLRALIREKEDGWLCGTGCLRIRFGEEGVNPLYASYYLSHPNVREWIVRHAHGATMPNLNTSILSALPFVVPPPPVQRAIAHIPGTLDDKIEMNRRMNETLEAMARALFKSWFIDFEPVRRNAARGRNQPSPPAPLPGGEGGRQYRGGYDFAGLVETARALRERQTPAEQIFWALVRDRRFLGLKFRRQHQLGDYIADFYCHERQLVVELDGGIHSEQRAKDHTRDAWMETKGFNVLRFKNEQMLDEPESVLTIIARAVDTTTSSPPSPAGRRAGDEGVGESCAFDHLFPDRFENSELGRIPEGWKVGSFRECVSLNKDTVNPMETPDEEFFHFSIPAYDERQSPKQEYGEAIKSQKFLVPGDAVLISKLNPEIERVWLVDVKTDERAVCSTEFLVFRAKAPFTRTFAYCLASSVGFRRKLEGLVTGTSKSHQRAQPEAILNLQTILPPPKVLEVFDRIVAPLLAKSQANKRESHALSSLRDTLLPKLISGELRVPQSFSEREPRR